MAVNEVILYGFVRYSDLESRSDTCFHVILVLDTGISTMFAKGLPCRSTAMTSCLLSLLSVILMSLSGLDFCVIPVLDTGISAMFLEFFYFLW